MNKFGWAIALLLLVGVGWLIFAPQPAAVPPAAKSAQPAPTVTAASPNAATGTFSLPVAGMRREQLIDTWNQAREGGARPHQAIDIMAPGGTPVVASFGGTIVKLFNSKAGGLTLYVREGEWSAYYAHLAGYAPGLREGQRVAKGERIGFVGDTGNAGAGNTHLHFAIHRMRPEERWWQGTPVNPYPLLAGGNAAR